MAMPIDKGPFHLSVEEVAVHVGRVILVEVDDNIALIFTNLHRILG
jgi:hypothetical protein